MSRLLVTGGAGFIGSHLCEALLRGGHEVVALDNFDDFYDPRIKRANLAGAAENPKFSLVEGDIRNPEDVQRAIHRGADVIVHLAARAGVRPSIEQPLLYQDVNVRGTMVMLEAARRIKGCKFIFGSSSSVYGNAKGNKATRVVATKAGVTTGNEATRHEGTARPETATKSPNVETSKSPNGNDEEFSPPAKKLRVSSTKARRNESEQGSFTPSSEGDNVDEPISPYAATKRAGELLCRTYHHLYGLPVTALRFFTVYGPRQRPDLAIHKFARLMEAGKAIPVFGDGSMMRDYTYIDDIVEGVMRAIEACSGFAIYNLGASRPIPLSMLIAELESALGRKAVIERLPMQLGDVERTFADTSLAQRELGYAPKTDFATGLARFVEWFRGDDAAPSRSRF